MSLQKKYLHSSSFLLVLLATGCATMSISNKFRTDPPKLTSVKDAYVQDDELYISGRFRTDKGTKTGQAKVYFEDNRAALTLPDFVSMPTEGELFPVKRPAHPNISGDASSLDIACKQAGADKREGSRVIDGRRVQSICEFRYTQYDVVLLLVRGPQDNEPKVLSLLHPNLGQRYRTTVDWLKFITLLPVTVVVDVATSPVQLIGGLYILSTGMKSFPGL